MWLPKIEVELLMKIMHFLNLHLHLMTVLSQGFLLHKRLSPNVPAPKRPALLMAIYLGTDLLCQA